MTREEYLRLYQALNLLLERASLAAAALHAQFMARASDAFAELEQQQQLHAQLISALDLIALAYAHLPPSDKVVVRNAGQGVAVLRTRLDVLQERLQCCANIHAQRQALPAVLERNRSAVNQPVRHHLPAQSPRRRARAQDRTVTRPLLSPASKRLLLRVFSLLLAVVSIAFLSCTLAVSLGASGPLLSIPIFAAAAHAPPAAILLELLGLSGALVGGSIFFANLSSRATRVVEGGSVAPPYQATCPAEHSTIQMTNLLHSQQERENTPAPAYTPADYDRPPQGDPPENAETTPEPPAYSRLAGLAR